MSYFSWTGPLYERDCGGNGMLSPGEKEEEEEEGGEVKIARDVEAMDDTWSEVEQTEAV